MVIQEQTCLSILILTEDSAKDGVATITALAKKMLCLADGATRTHRIKFEPQSEDAGKAIQGSLWKSNSPFDRPKLIALGRAIAAKLLEEGVPGFALFHVDGDRVWAERVDSENVARFEQFVRRYVEPSVEHALREQLKKHPRRVDVDRDKTRALKRLLPLTPFYSVEAWLYQNTAEALRLCGERCGLHTEKIRQWQTDRGALDEVHKPKEELCLRAGYNHALAGAGFPSDAVFYAGKSYAVAVLTLIDCADLLTALERTYS